MLAEQLRRRRRAAGMTQAALAHRAGVSRQLVGAVEQGRHVPRADAAVALAGALGCSVEQLLTPARPPALPVVGPPHAPGTPVRVGRVDDRPVTAPAVRDDRWQPADGVVGPDGLRLLDAAPARAVVAGCDPALGLAEHLPAAGRLLAVPAGTAAALDALAGRRAHAALVHGPEPIAARATPPLPGGEPSRVHLARWRVGLAAPADRGDLLDAALAGRQPTIQREPGASAQQALARHGDRTGSGTPPAAGHAAGHLQAAGLASAHGLPALTIEPAALARGLAFRALEEHAAELWVDRALTDAATTTLLVDLLTDGRLRRQLRAVGGYDLADAGQQVAA